MYFWYVIVELFFVLYIRNGICTMWPKGVVHFSINNKDYDIHSQDVILSTLGEIEKEICVKFFNSPQGYNSTARVLYINNPNKRKGCPPDVYDFSGNVVDMPIGYKCIDQKNISNIIVDMLRASIEQTAPIINSFDLIRKFQEMEHDHTTPFLLSSLDRNYINAHYLNECGSLTQPQRSQYSDPETRRSGALSMSQTNQMYYEDILWPLGIVMYGVEKSLRGSYECKYLKYNMMNIELRSGVVFKEVRENDKLLSKNLLWFAKEGELAPSYGFQKGNQTISLKAMAEGAPGHKAHTLNMLLRAMGVPMMSNRPDRDNYIKINWANVEKGMEHFFEKYPTSAWIRDSQLPYDFESATHASANFMCKGSSCSHGEATVEPLQDNLWKRVLWSMGRHARLSDGDVTLIGIMYDKQVRSRHVNHDE